VTVSSARELLLSARSARVESVVERRTRSIVVVLEDLEDPHNMSAVLRTCEGLGIQEVHTIARRYAFHPNRKISQGAEKWLDLRLWRTADRCLGHLRGRGYLLCATDLGEGSCSLLELPQDRPIALVFGTEKVGVTPETLGLCDLRFKIPMQGFAQSLNISVAVAICLSHLIFGRIRRAGTSGDLPEAERQALRKRFFNLAVKQRHRIFKAVDLASTDVSEEET
jgi:tRNA (guanosine-2'-O-)-methyltransferase